MNRKLKKHLENDPEANLQLEQYESPVPSRPYLLTLFKKINKPLTYDEIIEELGLDTEDLIEGLRRRLRAMMRDGQMVQNRKREYCVASKMDLKSGVVRAHRDGGGSVITETGSDDIFLTPRQMRQVFNGDRVLVRVVGGNRRRPEGQVVEILEHNTNRIVGRFFSEDGIFYVAPDNKRINKDILIPPEHNELNAKDGEIVVAEIMAQPSMRRSPIGRITEVLGDKMAPGMEIDIALRSHDLPHVWLEEALQQIESLPKEVTAEDCKGRKDLKHLPFVTIDGEDARDFDDAVYCEPIKKSGWVLYVAIADVSHYVKPDSPLDKAGYVRGNSTYFPSNVIPMLPEELSNELCSLKPLVDRLSLVCEARISATGKLSRYRFYPAVIHSHARLTYTEVAKVLEGDTDSWQHDPHLIGNIKDLASLYEVLLAQRKKRGAIDFDMTETQIIFDDNKKIKTIAARTRNDAHRLIEECMILANIATARFLSENKIPALYRIHESPAEKRLNELQQFLAEFGLHLPGRKKVLAKDYSKICHEIQGRPDSYLLQTVLLRSLNQAVYSPEQKEHFGLACKDYTHFTSPIRRYPDLLVHRAIKHVIERKPVKKFIYDTEKMKKLGEHCSMTERRSDEATRDVTDWLKCEYMQNKVECEFSGIITGVTGFGLFVQLDELFVEGLVHVTSLKNDYYHFDAARHVLTGERMRFTYRLGDKIKIRVIRVDLDERQIDFELA